VAARSVVGVACNLEICPVGFFYCDREKLRIERNLWSSLRPRAFVPACQRDLDQIRPRLDLRLDGAAQLASITELSRE